MKLGQWKVSILETGDFRLDGGAMFGVVPQPMWSRSNPPDTLNRIAMTTRSLLIESADRKILVDTGCGDKDSAKFREIYAIDSSERSLGKALAEHGLSNSDITDVILTHLHFDHCGGCTALENGMAVPVFPQARHYVQKRHFEHAQNPTERDRASFLPPNFMPLHESGILELVDGDGDLFPGIRLLRISGHTPAQQMVVIEGDDGGLWFAADLLPMKSHLPVPYVMGYDLFPLTTVEEKKRFVPQALDSNWAVVFEHDPDPVPRLLVPDNKGYALLGDQVEI